jgi:hypothetical protein
MSQSQQYYDTETGGDEIIAVETDQDTKNKGDGDDADEQKIVPAGKPTATSSSKSRSLPTSTGIDWSGCCNTKKKRWVWCGLLITVVFIVGIALLATSLKKLNSTEVRSLIPVLFDCSIPSNACL